MWGRRKGVELLDELVECAFEDREVFPPFCRVVLVAVAVEDEMEEVVFVGEGVREGVVIVGGGGCGRWHFWMGVR